MTCPYDETPEERAARQRLSAITTVEALSAVGEQFAPMMEVVDADGPVVLLGWNQTSRGAQASFFTVGMVLALAAAYTPVQLCVVLPARCRRLSNVEQVDLPREDDLGEDPAAQEALLFIQSTTDGDTIELLPYGRDDSGYLTWQPAYTDLGEHPAADQVGITRLLREFWHPGYQALLGGGDPCPHTREVTARVFVPSLQVYSLRGG